MSRGTFLLLACLATAGLVAIVARPSAPTSLDAPPDAPLVEGASPQPELHGVRRDSGAVGRARAAARQRAQIVRMEVTLPTVAPAAPGALEDVEGTRRYRIPSTPTGWGYRLDVPSEWLDEEEQKTAQLVPQPLIAGALQHFLRRALGRPSGPAVRLRDGETLEVTTHGSMQEDAARALERITLTPAWPGEPLAGLELARLLAGPPPDRQFALQTLGRARAGLRDATRTAEEQLRDRALARGADGAPPPTQGIACSVWRFETKDNFMRDVGVSWYGKQLVGKWGEEPGLLSPSALSGGAWLDDTQMEVILRCMEKGRLPFERTRAQFRYGEERRLDLGRGVTLGICVPSAKPHRSRIGHLVTRLSLREHRDDQFRFVPMPEHIVFVNRGSALFRIADTLDGVAPVSPTTYVLLTLEDLSPDPEPEAEPAWGQD